MDTNKIIEELDLEKKRLFIEQDWSESEIQAYEIGFSKALLIIIDALKEKGIK
jgi:hypothetical protein